MWHDSFPRSTWLIHTCNMTGLSRHPKSATEWPRPLLFRPIHTWDMTHFHVWHDSFPYATWLIHPGSPRTLQNFPEPCYRDPFTRVTCLIHKCDMTHSCTWHDSFIQAAHERYRLIPRRGGGLGSSNVFKNLMSPTLRRKWYLTTGRRAH